MPRHSESVESVRRYYDALGEQEWERLTKTVRGRVSLELHRRFLRRFVRPGWRVLEVGAGPGRFTLELAAIGCRIVVTDVSEVQLALNEARLDGTDAERRVERREVLDVCDASRYADGEFDAVVAFGGPLSYAFERTDEAMRGLLRIVRPDGILAASVMSTLGGWRYFLPAITALSELVGEDANDRALRTGDLVTWSTTPAATSAACSAGARSRRWWNARVAGSSAGAPAIGHPWGTQRPFPGSNPTPTAGADSSSTRRPRAGSPAPGMAARTSCSPRSRASCPPRPLRCDGRATNRPPTVGSSTDHERQP